jgi:hypothetical protein
MYAGISMPLEYSCSDICDAIASHILIVDELMS